jgi:hypothetical protein
MPAEFYKVLHIVGLVMIAVALGGSALHAMNGGTRASNTARGLLAGTHGLGLLVMIVAGFGMLAKLGMMSGGMPGWVIGKLVIWLVLGALLGILPRAPQLARPIFVSLPILAGIAAWLAIYKPF